MYAPIAITGVAALFPGSTDRAGFWRDILTGKDLLSDVPSTHWNVDDYYDSDPSATDKTYCRRGAFLSFVEFDSLAFGIPPKNIPVTDSAQLLALIVARKVLDDASKGQFQKLNRDRISVILGVTAGTAMLADMASRLQRPVWLRALRESGISEQQAHEICERIAGSYESWQENTFPGLLGNVVAGRIANRLDLHGTNCVVDAACASSLSALSMGIHELYLGSSDLALVGGVDAINNIFTYMCFSKTHALSPTGDCRPFSAQADGTMLGEGIGMFALRRLEDAERDGDPIYAVIHGVGSSSDGSAKSIYAPEAEGQAIAMRRAYAAAAFGPETVELVEAHGTGTKAGDLAEFEGIRRVFEASGRADRQWCALGSVKSQVGHTKAAAGAAGLFKAVMAVHHKVLPPTIKVEQLNPELDFEHSPLYVNTRTRPWIRNSKHPRRAAVSSYGFGGSNFHVAIEEYTGKPGHAKKIRAFESELIVVSEDSVEALIQQCARIKESLAAASDISYLAWKMRQLFESKKYYRLALVASDAADLSEKLSLAIDMLLQHGGSHAPNLKGIYIGKGESIGGLAFLFPGQGSQYLEMGAALAMTFDQARTQWDAAVDIIDDLHRHVFPPPVFTDKERIAQERALVATEWAQPAIGAMSAACLGVLSAIGLTASCMAGHSFGELTALHAAGVMSYPDFMRAAQRRGQLMAEAARNAPGGAMTAAKLSAELIATIAEWGGGAAIANLNSPRQTVLTGTSAAIDHAENELAQKGVDCFHLPVATAFHSPMVSSACEPFEDFLEGIALKPPAVPVYSNTTAKTYPTDGAAIRALLAHQIERPVLFSRQIEHMYESGVRIFVEIGPSDVLSRLTGECLVSRDHLAIAVDRKSMPGLDGLWHALAQLAVSGVPMQLGQLDEAFELPPDMTLAKRPALPIWINGSNSARNTSKERQAS